MNNEGMDRFGVGCRVSGVGCRVSGVGCRVSGVGVSEVPAGSGMGHGATSLIK